MSLEEKLEADFDKQLADMVKPNLMVVGGTGVGKSSLINKVFGEEITKVGVGEPVTKGCNKLERDHVPIVIFDTEGYEIANGNYNFKSKVIAEIKRREFEELRDNIHLFWYCISASGNRVTDYDIENIKELNGFHAELAIVITQCDTEEINERDEGVTSLAFRNVLIEAGINNKVFETAVVLEADLQLDDLIEWSSAAISNDGLRDAFIGAQLKSIELKDKRADEAILLASGSTAVAAGLNPIPMSDSLAIVPIQMALAVRLAGIYGFEGLSGGVLSLLKAQVVSMVGRQMAASLTKLIPILGQVINAGIAAGITTALGYALKNIYRSAYKETLETGKSPDWVALFSGLDLYEYIKVYMGKH